MKKMLYGLVLIGCMGLASSCANNQTRIGEGAGIGAGLGALAGGIIGYQTHDTATGVLVGGALGAAGGAAVGAQIPKEHPQAYTQPSYSQVTMQQVIDLTKQGLTSDEVISRIKNSKSTYSLTAEDISYLQKQGVSQRVIETMQASK